MEQVAGEVPLQLEEIEKSPDLLWVINRAGQMVLANGQTHDFLGEEQRTRQFIHQVYESDRSLVAEFYEQLKSGLEPQPVEFRLALSGDDYHWIIERCLPRPVSGFCDDHFISAAIDITARKNMVRAFKKIDQKYHDLTESACDWFWEMDSELRISSMSSRFFEIFDLSPEQIIGKTRTELAQADVLTETWQRHLLDLKNRRVIRNFNYDINLVGDRTRYVVINGKPVFDEDGEFMGYRGTGTDITEEVEARMALEKAHKETSFLLAELRLRQDELAEQNRQFDAALDNMSQGLCMFDKNKQLVVCNEKYIDMYDLPRQLGTSGTSLRQILEYRVNAGVYSGDDPEKYIEERLESVVGQESSTKIQYLTNGRVIAIVHQPMAEGGWVATHEDITELQRVQAQVTHMAYHDALTDLPNRVQLRERIEDRVPLAARGQGFAILCLGLDRFKSVNDTLGHQVGDELLIAVSQRIRGCVRQNDIVASLGGDEFAILQVSNNQPRDARLLATRIFEVLADPVSLTDHQIVTGASIGIAIAPSDGSDADTLLKNADMALYRAKNDGGGVFRFFETEMDERLQVRRGLELDLRKALDAGEFEIYYQPLVNMETGVISGFESLLRWQHPHRGMVPPAEFIPIAEEIGLIIPIGEWVIRQACSQAASWPVNVKVAVNLSPSQFSSDTLVSTVFSALSSSRIAAGRLELEITENALLGDEAGTLKILHKFREMGVRIAMDDFGTGYSSLSYLRSFPFDKIKIDGSFVRDLTNRDDAVAIVNAVAVLSRNLGMTTTAEGVETEEQLQLVKAAGYTEVQGYYFSKPVPVAKIPELFSHNSMKMAASGT